MALDLPSELLLAEVDGVLDVARGVLRTQRDALEEERRLDDQRARIGTVALVGHLDLQAGEFGDLPPDLAEPALDVLAQVLGDGDVAALDLDLHRDLPLVVPLGGDPLMERWIKLVCPGCYAEIKARSRRLARRLCRHGSVRA